jgi:hypothetical protein
MPGKKADIIGFRINSNWENWYDLPFDAPSKQVDFYMADGKF